MKKLTAMLTVLIIMAICVPDTALARRQPKQELSNVGNMLLNHYSSQLNNVKAQIERAIPQINEQEKSAYLKACQAEEAAKARLETAQKNRGKVGAAQGLVNHAKGKWIGGADKGIANAKAKLKKATTDAEREAAQKELAKWQKNREDGVQALKERQAALDKAKAEEPKLIKELEQAQQALAQAKAKSMQAFKDLDLSSILAGDNLDAHLAKYVVLSEATPHGLAAFAQQGLTEKRLIDQLLSDPGLMIQMVVADGAKDGKYAQAMKIYTDIQKASDKAKDGNLQRLALAISLEHAVPVKQRNPESATNAPATVDPVNRYLHFEKAYFDNELDPAFNIFSAWDYRMVVDGDEPDEILTWGRQMLRNYRPDHILTSDYRWRYVALVRSDVQYGSQDNKYDKPELQFYQNILMNGGICGRRAFIGRLLLRAFGIPTTARPQRGHAALGHWTPDGWVINLGGGWGAGWTKTRYGDDKDFLATTQAREHMNEYMQVKRAQWIGDVVGEKPVFGLNSRHNPGFWYGASLYLQRAINENAITLAAVGTDIGEANETKEKVEIIQVDISEDEKKIRVDRDGTITIPAAAASKPTRSTGKIIFMPSVLGGKQLHYSRTGGSQNFEYTFDAPKTGKYALTARVVTPSWKQHLTVKANSDNSVDIALPFTVGMWDETKPVQVTLQKGRNVLTFSRSHDKLKGITIKDFTLKPLR